MRCSLFTLCSGEIFICVERFEFKDTRDILAKKDYFDKWIADEELRFQKSTMLCIGRKQI